METLGKIKIVKLLQLICWVFIGTFIPYLFGLILMRLLDSNDDPAMIVWAVGLLFIAVISGVCVLVKMVGQWLIT